MISQNKIFSILIGVSLLIPTALVAQQANAQTSLQSQLDAVQQKVDILKQSLDERPGLEQDSAQPNVVVDPDEDTGKGNELHIEGITPKSGHVGDKVSLSVSDNVLDSDWVLHFGEDYQPLLPSRDDISVSADRAGAGITFRVPKTLTTLSCPEDPGTADTGQASCEADVTPDVYPVWIESDDNESNAVMFKVAGSDQPSEDPDKGNNENPRGASQANEGPSSGTKPVEGTTGPNSGTTGQPTEGSTGPTSGTAGQPTEGSTGPTQETADTPTAGTEPTPGDSAEISRVLEQVRVQIQSIVEQVFGSR